MVIDFAMPPALAADPRRTFIEHASDGGKTETAGTRSFHRF
jgi:hypothetical protein